MALPKQLNAIQRDEKKLNSEHAKIRAMLQVLVKEQKTIIEKADARITKASKNIRALQHRLKPYADGKKDLDTDHYRRMKAEYEGWLRDRAHQHQIINMAEESIAEAQLSKLPQQFGSPMAGV